jgi:diadenosine tetraphosphate (Ap4A) HIT family hydrolase
MRKPANKFSHLTAIERNKLSTPVQFLLDRKLLKGRILDFGCGLGTDVKLLHQQGLDITGYDAYYAPTAPTGKFETIVCCYVLNVLMPAEQAEVLMEIAHLLKPGGKAYYAVRRDLKKEGFREHYVHKQPTYQCIVKLPFTSLLLTEYCEIYEYIHFNHRKHSPNNCIFCNPHRQLNLITESATAYAIFDGYPLSKGHALIVPKRHLHNYFELPAKEQSACWLMANKVQKILTAEFHPDGFNVGMNIDRAAGQAMNHATIHVIPRYHGDTNSKKSGMRSVIPKN